MVHQVGNSLYTAIMCYVNIESHRLIVGFRYPLGGEGIVPTVVPHVAREKQRYLLTVSVDQQTGYCCTSFFLQKQQ